MTNNPTHAERGVPMALMWRNNDCHLALLNWTGERLESVDGDEWYYTNAWLKGGKLLYRYTPAGWQLVLPPKNEKVAVQVPTVGGLTPDEHEFAYGDASKDEETQGESPSGKARDCNPRIAGSIPASPSNIEVGSQWVDDDGLQYVVISFEESDDGPQRILVRAEGDDTERDEFDYFRGHKFDDTFTHLFTPKPDLSNVEDGAKIVGFDGEVVTCRRAKRAIALLDPNGHEKFTHHSVNDLPSWVGLGIRDEARWEWRRQSKLFRATGPAMKFPCGKKLFALGDGFLSPAEWGREIATNPKYDASKVLEEYRHLLPAEEPETVVISECDRETGIPTAPDLELPAGMPLPEQVAAINAHFTEEPETVLPTPDGGEKGEEEYPLSIQDIYEHCHRAETFEESNEEFKFKFHEGDLMAKAIGSNDKWCSAWDVVIQRALLAMKFRIAKEAADE